MATHFNLVNQQSVDTDVATCNCVAMPAMTSVVFVQAVHRVGVCQPEFTLKHCSCLQRQYTAFRLGGCHQLV